METKTKPTKVKKSRPYNRYNLFFILERERLVLSKGGSTKWSNSANAEGSRPTEGDKVLGLPPLPRRFAHLQVPGDWCIPGKERKRAHRKSHGVLSFRDVVRDVAESWKTVDEETLHWCTAVEKILMQRHEELKKAIKGVSKPPTPFSDDIAFQKLRQRYEELKKTARGASPKVPAPYDTCQGRQAQEEPRAGASSVQRSHGVTALDGRRNSFWVADGAFPHLAPVIRDQTPSAATVAANAVAAAATVAAAAGAAAASAAAAERVAGRNPSSHPNAALATNTLSSSVASVCIRGLSSGKSPPDVEGASAERCLDVRRPGPVVAGLRALLERGFQLTPADLAAAEAAADAVVGPTCGKLIPDNIGPTKKLKDQNIFLKMQALQRVSLPAMHGDFSFQPATVGAGATAAGDPWAHPHVRCVPCGKGLAPDALLTNDSFDISAVMMSQGAEIDGGVADIPDDKIREMWCLSDEADLNSGLGDTFQ